MHNISLGYMTEHVSPRFEGPEQHTTQLGIFLPPALKRAGDFFGAALLFDFLERTRPASHGIGFLSAQIREFLSKDALISATLKSPIPFLGSAGRGRPVPPVYAIHHLAATSPARYLLHRLLSLAVRSDPEANMLGLYHSFHAFMGSLGEVMSGKEVVALWVDAHSERTLHRISLSQELLETCHTFFTMCLYHLLKPILTKGGEFTRHPSEVVGPSSIPENFMLSLSAGQRHIQRAGEYVVMGIVGAGLWCDQDQTMRIMPTDIIHHVTFRDTEIKNVSGGLLQIFCAAL